MKNTKIIIAGFVIVVVGLVAYVIGHRQGSVVTDMQSASVIKAANTAGSFKTSRWDCWWYGGTWTEYAGGRWDCKWLTTAPAPSTK